MSENREHILKFFIIKRHFTQEKTENETGHSSVLQCLTKLCFYQSSFLKE